MEIEVSSQSEHIRARARFGVHIDVANCINIAVMSCVEPTETTTVTFLDLPDDVILIIANSCAEGTLSTQSIPVFSQVHRRFSGVLGDDFWKQWCHGAGYAIREYNDSFLCAEYRINGNVG